MCARVSSVVVTCGSDARSDTGSSMSLANCTWEEDFLLRKAHTIHIAENKRTHYYVICDTSVWRARCNAERCRNRCTSGLTRWHDIKANQARASRARRANQRRSQRRLANLQQKRTSLRHHQCQCLTSFRFQRHARFAERMNLLSNR
jgi:hypothetical protein